MSAHETLGLLLVREGLITRPQLYDALRLQRQTGRLLGTCLLSLGYVRPEALLAMLSRQLSIPALPPGTLNRASPDAVRRVPREVAFRLRILPYSWDGQMLGVAVADGRVLSQLHEVAYHARAAVGAYVALETEIEAVLRTVYPDAAAAAPVTPAPLDPVERPRPPRTVAPDGPVVPSDRHWGAERRAEGQLPTRRPAPAALAKGEVVCPALERFGFLDSVEKLYEAETPGDVGRMVGRALLNYFNRVLVLESDGRTCRAVGCAGFGLSRSDVPESALPLTMAKLGERQLAYGRTNTDVRSAELAGVFGFEPGATALVAAVGEGVRPRLLVLADNGGSTDLYEDLHDIELLFKEAETGLGMLLDRLPA